MLLTATLKTAAAARSAIGGGSMVHRPDVDVGLHRLAAVPGTMEG